MVVCELDFINASRILLSEYIRSKSSSSLTLSYPYGKKPFWTKSDSPRPDNAIVTFRIEISGHFSCVWMFVDSTMSLSSSLSLPWWRTVMLIKKSRCKRVFHFIQSSFKRFWVTIIIDVTKIKYRPFLCILSIALVDLPGDCSPFIFHTKHLEFVCGGATQYAYLYWLASWAEYGRTR